MVEVVGSPNSNDVPKPKPPLLFDDSVMVEVVGSPNEAPKPKPPLLFDDFVVVLEVAGLPNGVPKPKPQLLLDDFVVVEVVGSPNEVPKPKPSLLFNDVVLVELLVPQMMYQNKIHRYYLIMLLLSLNLLVNKMTN